MSKDLNFVVGDNAKQRLISFVERVERLAEEISGLQDDTKEVFAEAKGEGFDVPTMRKAIRLRKMDPAKRKEAEALLDLYMGALGDAESDEDED